MDVWVDGRTNRQAGRQAIIFSDARGLLAPVGQYDPSQRPTTCPIVCMEPN